MDRQDVEGARVARREIMLRIAIQNTILILLMPLLLMTIVAACALPAGAGLIALGYVGTAGMGALFWIHSGARMVQLRTYLQAVERSSPAGAGWETWLAQNRIHGILGSRWFISTKGVFVGSQLGAILVCGPLMDGLDRPLPILLALLVSLATAVLLVQPRMAR